MTTGVRQATRWMDMLRASWNDDLPIRIHAKGLDAGGAPRIDPEFWAWLNGYQHQNGEKRYRVTSAMRRLRKESVREYEVAYRMIVLHESAEDTSKWLNERAIRNNKPERYSVRDTMVILTSAIDKLLVWY